ncbi:MAG TPA: hypothetical protein VIV01_24825, partial [Hyphomicrobiaceae bacterium]
MIPYNSERRAFEQAAIVRASAFRQRRNALRGSPLLPASSRLHTTGCQGVKCVQLGYVLGSNREGIRDPIEAA